jgi:hypothetical protein
MQEVLLIVPGTSLTTPLPKTSTSGSLPSGMR